MSNKPFYCGLLLDGPTEAIKGCYGLINNSEYFGTQKIKY